MFLGIRIKELRGENAELNESVEAAEIMVSGLSYGY